MIIMIMMIQSLAGIKKIIILIFAPCKSLVRSVIFDEISTDLSGIKDKARQSTRKMTSIRRFIFTASIPESKTCFHYKLGC